MSDDQRPRTSNDRVMGTALLVAGLGVCLGAPLLALPWALEEGWQSPRFLTYFAAALSAIWLGISAGRTVRRRMQAE